MGPLPGPTDAGPVADSVVAPSPVPPPGFERNITPNARRRDPLAKCGTLGAAAAGPLTAAIAGFEPSVQVRQHLGGDELEVLEVAEVDELQVDTVGAELPKSEELVDRGIR